MIVFTSNRTSAGCRISTVNMKNHSSSISSNNSSRLRKMMNIRSSRIIPIKKYKTVMDRINRRIRLKAIIVSIRAMLEMAIKKSSSLETGTDKLELMGSIQAQKKEDQRRKSNIIIILLIIAALNEAITVVETIAAMVSATLIINLLRAIVVLLHLNRLMLMVTIHQSKWICSMIDQRLIMSLMRRTQNSVINRDTTCFLQQLAIFTVVPITLELTKIEDIIILIILDIQMYLLKNYSTK